MFHTKIIYLFIYGHNLLQYRWFLKRRNCFPIFGAVRMAQHGMKKKTTLPAGAKQKSMKRVQKGAQYSKGPKKGAKAVIAPKKLAAVQQAKANAEISRVINEKNEEMVKERADRDVGKTKKKRTNSSA